MDRVFMKGCEAIAEAAVRSGCRFFAGYPITPQNEIPEYFSRRMPDVGGTFIQAESELASINMVFGAGATGTRCMTSSSSCGISLKTEGISYMAGARVPAVVCSVMRGGPGVGSIKPSQQDYLQATKAPGHGGLHALVLVPSTVQEAAEATYYAFDLADKYRSPVLVLIDGFTATMMEPVVLPKMRSQEEVAALKQANSTWSLTGRSLDRDRRLISSCGGEEMNIRDAALYAEWEKNEVRVQEHLLDDAEVVIASYGISARISMSAISILRKRGYKVGMIRPVTAFPFPYHAFERLDYSRVKAVLDVEISIPPQMIEDVKLGVLGRAPIATCLRSGGEIVSRDAIVEAARRLCETGGSRNEEGV